MTQLDHTTMSAPALSTAQKKAVREFRNITGATEKAAEVILTRARWSMEHAVDIFYSGGGLAAMKSAAPKLGDEGRLNAMFDKYADAANSSEMAADGMQSFFEDINVDPAGVLSIAVAWKLGCKQMGVITRSEFVKSLSVLGVDTMPTLTQAVEQIRVSLNDPTTFREMHKWVFHFVKGGEQKRSLEKEMAVELLRLLIDAAKHPLITSFLDFLTQHKDKGVPRDVWEMTLEFVSTTKADLSNFDENGAWPVIMDEFVVWYRAQNK